jgi:hypothetical protein
MEMHDVDVHSVGGVHCVAWACALCSEGVNCEGVHCEGVNCEGV